MLKNLVISAGSMKTVAVLGCIKYLEEQVLLSNVTTLVGTSAGAILSLFLILGYSTREIEDFLKFHILKNGLHELSLDELFNLGFLQTFGLDSGEKAQSMLGDIVEKKLRQRDITFVELSKKTGKTLVVCVANLTTRQPEYFCLDTHPETSVVMAIRMSMSLPFIFTPVEYNGCLYVDGGIFESLPVGYIQNSFKDPLKDTLALRVSSDDSNREKTPQNLFDYTISLLDSIIEKANILKYISEKVRVVDVELDVSNYMSLDFQSMAFDFDEKTIDTYISKGYDIMRKCFEERIQ
jgi:predicted acylesterase/phospholipase RssA